MTRDTLTDMAMRQRSGSEKVADEHHDDLKEDASLSFRANAADLASMLVIGKHIDDLTRDIDPDSSVTDHDLSSWNHQVRHSTGRSSGSDTGRTACVDPRGAQGASDVSPRTADCLRRLVALG